ncbi:MAG: 3,4-dihydroxy-2-butanone-4-phosphate synthase [Rhodospirillales bacterium]|nr:3,4-dihydroxy-2-butanone-4-phosphate synthase [Rhodospirillales bacterium]
MNLARAEETSADFSLAEDLVADIAAGRMVILVDEESRENEGDLVMAAAHVTPASIAFMADQGRGLICLALSGAMADRLDLKPLPARHASRFGTAFLDPIEARRGVTTGISAADRAHTILTAIDPRSTPGDISTPGHVFPLRARDGGVLERAGHTEAAVDLARLAGLAPAGVICEIMGPDGTMLRGADLVKYARHAGLKIGAIADLIRLRRDMSLMTKF